MIATSHSSLPVFHCYPEQFEFFCWTRYKNPLQQQYLFQDFRKDHLLLSNTNHIHLDAFNKIYYTGSRNKPFEKFFDKIYYSCEIGLRKPNADIYEFVLKENDLEAAKTLFIDDSVQNIEAANAVGLQTILLKPGMYIEDLGL